MKRTWLLTLRETLGLLGLFLHPSRARAHAVYDFLGTHNNLAEESLYLNLGYWREAESYDQACEALALLLAREAGVSAGDTILDAGFGFADQDRLWAETFSPSRIVGLNVTASQVEVARTRVADPRVELLCASATAMPFDGGVFDRVLALESAFHFDTRESFFREAWRVLKPGGKLAVADVIPRPRRRSLKLWLGEQIGRAFWQIPAANMYPAEVYEEKLRAAGFTDCRIESISDQVFVPFKRYARRRAEAPEVSTRAHPFLRAVWRSPHEGFAAFDYIIATAAKGQ